MPRPPIGYRSTSLLVAKPTVPRPALPEDRGEDGRLNYPLGAWQGDGSFKFYSPDAARQWNADSFMQGSHQQHWMKGRPLSPDETKLAEMGLPHSDDVYRGPDGQRYQSTPASREDPHLRAIRAAHLAAEPVQGSATEMGKRASLRALPKAMEAMARDDRMLVAAKSAAANDNRAAANENKPNAKETASGRPGASETQMSPAKTYPGIGRFAATAKATKQAGGHLPTPAESAQDVDDAIRLTANAVTVDNADKVAAAGNALGSLFTDETYGDAYRRNLADEEKKTAEARERLGLLGAGVEAAPTFVPGYGDVLGVATDLKMYRDHPEERNWKNYGLTALGALPFTPSVAGVIKKVDKAIDAGEDGTKALRAAFSRNYPETFFTAHPHLRGKVNVHRAIEHQVLEMYPGLFTEAEIFALDNLRGIPNELNSDLHLSQIRKGWNRFYDANPEATREDILNKVVDIDQMFGHQFLPARGDKQ